MRRIILRSVDDITNDLPSFCFGLGCIIFLFFVFFELTQTCDGVLFIVCLRATANTVVVNFSNCDQLAHAVVLVRFDSVAKIYA